MSNKRKPTKIANSILENRKVYKYIKLFFSELGKKLIKFRDLVNSYDLDNQPTPEIRTPVMEFTSRFLEVVLYGLLLTIVLNSIIGWQGWKNLVWLFSLGLMRWLILDFKHDWTMNGDDKKDG